MLRSSCWYVNGILDDFTEKLQDGKLPSSIKSLYSAKFKEVNDTIKKYSGKKYTDVLSKFSTSLDSILNMKIHQGLVRQALKSQSISAYMVTYKKGPVMEVLKNYLKPACNVLAKTRSEFANLIIMKEQESEAGQGTRVGVVPLHINDFEEFTQLFAEAFKIAAKDLGVAESKHKGKSFSANLIRIIPSPLAFKQVLSNDDLPKSDPIKTVISLIQKDFDPLDRLKIAATSKGKDSADVVLKELLTTVFDETPMISFLDDSINYILTENSKLKDILQSSELRNILFAYYEIQKNTELAEILYLDSSSNYENTLNQFRKYLELILNKQEITLSELDFKKLVHSLFENYVNVAKFLRGKL